MLPEKVMVAAQGYLELEMPDEALREINSLPDEVLREEGPLQVKMAILMRLKRWTEALAICADLRKLFPEQTVGYVHGAFCLHEIGRTREAKELLLSGPPSLLQEPTYHYNLGCYDAVLGNLTEAQSHLKLSFQLNEKFREIAKYDPDLKAMTEWL